jgi:hypothetical protein
MHVEDDQEFQARLGELVEQLGSKAALARRAGVPVSSLQSWLAGSEPSRLALSALARAGNCRLEWLIDGTPPKEARESIPGYIEFRSYNLTHVGAYVRGVSGLPSDRRFFKQDDLVGNAAIAGLLMAVEGCEELAFEPDIHGGDVLIYEQPRGHNPWIPSFVDTWDLQDDAIHLIGDGVALRLRRMHKLKGTITIIDPNGKVERELAGSPRDFIWFGPIVWRGGVLKPLPKASH